MLNAYLYRVRRSLLKHPWKIILFILFALIFGFMIAYPTLMAMPNSDGSVSSSFVPRDTAVVIGGVYLILVVMFNFMFYTGLKNGVVGFSTADVVYHMAGPFTPRFNLILAASGTMQICFVFAFLLCTQTAIIYSVFGLSSLDLIVLIVGSFISAILGYFTGSYFGAKYSDDDAKKNRIMTVGIVIDAICVLGFAASFLMTKPDIKALGAKGIFAAVGDSWFIKLFPGGGWITLIYDGIINGAPLFTVIGVVLTALALVLIFIAYSRTQLDYYDVAIEYAQKAHDIAEQRRAGVDSDTAAMTRRAKVGKEKLGGGTGASALTAIHFLMNKRGSKFFFVNPVGIMYRIITVFYLLIMGKDAERPEMLVVSAFMMMIIMNAVLYAGGKTVTEFTKHYIYLIPETSRSKLFACIRADIPEMAFDSVVCGVLMYAMCHFSIPASAAFALMMLVFDMLCETGALLIMRLLPALGRYLLMVVRNLGVMALVGIACIPVVIMYFVAGTYTAALLAGAGTGAVMLLILLPIAAVVVNRAEM